MIIYTLFSKRKFLWIINVLVFNLCRIIPFRDNKLWVFGAYGGRKYEDNSRALFEHIYEFHKGEIRPVWLTYNKDELYKVCEAGYEGYLINSWKGKWISIRCGVAYMTHGIDDFGSIPLVGGALVVALWHGVGFKKIYGATYQGYKIRIMRIMNFFFSWTYRNITCATSEYTRKQFYIRFNANENNTYITGQPRNDFFSKAICREEVLTDIKILANKKIILYMPTYRWGKEGNFIMQKIVNALITNIRLNDILERMNCVFLIKLHPVTLLNDMVCSDNIFVLKDRNVRSSQGLLAIADCLVTDYSSCFTDYALLNRPIIFFTPDHLEYLKNATDMDKEYYALCSINKASTIDELVDMIHHLYVGDLMKQTDEINKYFNDILIRNTCYSENVYKLIYGKILKNSIYKFDIF